MKNVVKARLSAKELAIMLIVIFVTFGASFYDSDPILAIISVLVTLGACRAWTLSHSYLCTRCGTRPPDGHLFCGKCARIKRRALKLERLERLEQDFSVD